MVYIGQPRALHGFVKHTCLHLVVPAGSVYTSLYQLYLSIPSCCSLFIFCIYEHMLYIFVPAEHILLAEHNHTCWAYLYLMNIFFPISNFFSCWTYFHQIGLRTYMNPLYSATLGACRRSTLCPPPRPPPHFCMESAFWWGSGPHGALVWSPKNGDVFWMVPQRKQNIGATIRISREIRCLPYAGF